MKPPPEDPGKSEEAEPGRKPFKLRDASFKGRGLHPSFANATWDKIRDLAYDREPSDEVEATKESESGQ